MKVKKKTRDRSSAAKRRWEGHKAQKEANLNRTIKARQALQAIKKVALPKPKPLTMKQGKEHLYQTERLVQENERLLDENEKLNTRIGHQK